MANETKNNAVIATTVQTAENKKENKIWAAVKDYLYIPLTLLISYIIFGVVLLYGIVPSGSMEPTFMTGSAYIGTRLAYPSVDSIHHGDIVVFMKDGKSLVKRVIGLPGDTVHIDGQVTVNGEVVDEDYLPVGTVTKAGTATDYTVPENCFFAMGDNRGNSYDSRYWTSSPYFTYDDVVGTIWFACKIPFWDQLENN